MATYTIQMKDASGNIFLPSINLNNSNYIYVTGTKSVTTYPDSNSGYISVPNLSLVVNNYAAGTKDNRWWYSETITFSKACLWVTCVPIINTFGYVMVSTIANNTSYTEFCISLWVANSLPSSSNPLILRYIGLTST